MQFRIYKVIPIKIQGKLGNTLAGLTVLDRGYTGHEHLQSVALINMNARLYDPMLHRFLGIDNYIQDPTNTQNFNNYGYVLNNPLLYTDPSGNTYGSKGKDCLGCNVEIDYGGGEGSGGTSIDLDKGWKDSGMKKWWNKNLNFNNWGKTWDKIFGGRSSGPPPNVSKYSNLNNYSYTSTHQTGKKGEWRSNLGDQIKLKTYVSLRIGKQEMFDVNDTFFKMQDEGRNYQFNLSRYNLNFRPKDNRVRFMWPSDDHVSNGISVGRDGMGYHYNIRGKNGRSGGFDAAFRPGGHTLLLAGKIILSMFQPEMLPVVAEESMEEFVIFRALAY